MPTPYYPADLPGPSDNSFGPANQLISTEEENQPLALRRRSRDPGGTSQVTFEFLENDYRRFVQWWKVDLLRGHKWFWLKTMMSIGYRYQLVRFVSCDGGKLKGHTHWSVSAEIEFRDRFKQWDGIVVDISASANGWTLSSVGKTVGGFQSTDILTLSLPPGLTYQGLSGWPADDSLYGGPPPAGQYWGNGFIVTGGPGPAVGPNDVRSWNLGYNVGWPDGPTACAAFTPAQITGYTEYTFWVYDSNPNDNRGGQSIKIMWDSA